MTVKPWACQFIGDKRKTMPVEEAVQNAKDFDLLVAHELIYQPHVAAMKSANQNLRLLVYLNSTFTWRASLDETTYAHDKNGNRVTAKGWTNTYLVDISNPAATAYMQQEAQRLLASSGYSDLYLDVSGFAPLSTGYVSAVPINPNTGRAWGKQAWTAAINAHISGIRDAVGQGPYIVRNCLSNGGAYYDPTNPTSAFLIPAVQGAVCEGFLRSSSAPVTTYPSETLWAQNVHMLDDAASRGFDVYAMTKVWSVGTAGQKDGWYAYALASFLQGGNGRHSLSVTLQEGDNLQARDPWRLDLSVASPARALPSGACERDFDRGRSLVNPTQATAYLNPVSCSGATIGGSPLGVTDQIALPPNATLVLQDA